jgi:tetratricopeptide (TPR) repeat protein
MSFLFGLLALRCLLFYIDKEKILYFILANICFFLSLLSKESSVTWLGVFPLSIWCVTNVDLKKTIVSTIPFFIIFGIFMAIRTSILGTVTGETEILLINNSLVGTNDKMMQIATAFAVLGKYLGLLFLPITLIFDYSYNTIPNVPFSNIKSLLPLLIYVSLFVYAIKELPKRNLLAYGILFFLGTISLLSNIFFLLEATMAERFVYTPSLGFCITIIVLASKVFKLNKGKTQSITVTDIRKPGTLHFIVIGICSIFSVRTMARNSDWKDNLTLLAKDVQSAPESARIRYAYGSAILVEQALKEENPAVKNNLLQKSIEQLNKGVSLIPNYNDAWYNLGMAYKELGDSKNAVYAFDQARSYKPFNDASKLTNSGIAYGKNGQYDKAIADLTRAAELDNDNYEIYNNLGLYLGESGNKQASFEVFEKALKLKPDFDKVYYNRGNIHAQNKEYREAIEDYKKTLSINASFGDAYNNLGNCYAVLNERDSAKIWFGKSITIDPNNVKAIINLSIIYRSLGDTVTANQYLQKARAMGANF